MRVSRSGKIIAGGRSGPNTWVRFAEKRAERKLQQEDVAARLGVVESAVSAWEQGKYLPAKRHWLKIEELLGIPLADIAEYATTFSTPENNSHL